MLIYVTDINKFYNEKEFIENIYSASINGVKYIQLRYKNSSSVDKEKISKIIAKKIDRIDTKIIMNEDIEISKKFPDLDPRYIFVNSGFNFNPKLR